MDKRTKRNLRMESGARETRAEFRRLVTKFKDLFETAVEDTPAGVGGWGKFGTGLDALEEFAGDLLKSLKERNKTDDD